VWEQTNPDIIAVAFGGTVFSNQKDWGANLRWFTPGHRDEYTDVVQTFAPEFVKHLRRRLNDPTRPRSGQTTLIATGHSLGGGLAQQFAYSVPLDSPARVETVYAFDPSPVTGFYSVRRKLRDHNRRDLKIDRIYERGEVLALLRSLTSLVYRPTARNAAIRGVRYALFRAWNPVAAHSIVDLAAKLDCEAKAPPVTAQAADESTFVT
jgi:pimeloyl-ACP methyl ester carboxylesterase